MKKRPLVLYEKALKALKRAKEGCENKDLEAFENNIILFSIYSRSAIDSILYGIVVKLIEIAERMQRFPLKVMPREDLLRQLLCNLDFDAVLKMAIVLGDDTFVDKVRSLQQDIGRLASNDCWRLRNVFAHGHLYHIDIDRCLVDSPLLGNKTVTITDLESFLNELSKVIDKYKEIVNVS